MPLRYWDSEDNEGQSVATLEKRGNKLYISVRVPYEWLRTATYPVFIDTDVDETVVDVYGDAWEEEDGTGFAAAANSQVQIYSHASNRYFGGFHWDGVSVPNGATVGAASTAVNVWNSAADDPNLDIHAHDVDDSDDFNTDADVTTRVSTITAASAAWVATGTGTGWKTSPDITDPLQELFDRGGWVSGNNVCLLYVARSDSSKAFYINGYYASPGFAATLHIEYSAGATPDISNTPSSKVFGIVNTSSTYWSNGSEPTWVLVDGDAYFTITNNGDACSITIVATDFTGGVGWTLGVPAENVVRLTAFKEGDGSGDGITLTTSPQAFISGLITNIDWELKFETATAHTDGVAKESVITLTATLD